jgi:hypothetical protein
MFAKEHNKRTIENKNLVVYKQGTGHYARDEHAPVEITESHYRFSQKTSSRNRAIINQTQKRGTTATASESSAFLT